MQPTINDMMEAYSQDAEEYASKKFGFILDKSPGSVEDVEVIAAKLHNALNPGFLGRLFGKSPSEGEIEAICKMLGG